jgi:hypothetical protein
MIATRSQHIRAPFLAFWTNASLPEIDNSTKVQPHRIRPDVAAKKPKDGIPADLPVDDGNAALLETLGEIRTKLFGRNHGFLLIFSSISMCPLFCARPSP